MKSITRVTVGLILASVVVGCAGTKQYVPLPDQTKTVADATKARIYVVRPTVFGGAISMRVKDGDQVIGKTGPNGFLCWEREPGAAEISGKAENTAWLDLTAEQGNVYYIQQHVRMGFLYARNKLRLMSEEEGKRKVEKSKPPQLVGTL